jgi:glycosyltransferase involved in cell wall biosynthesis
MAKKLKIVFVNVTQGKVQRGGESFVQQIGKNLAKKHEITIISGNRVLPRRVPVLWRFFLDPNAIAILFFTLKNVLKIWRSRADIVVPINGGWQVLLTRLITWSYGGKMVVSGQSGIGWDDRVNLFCRPNGFVALSSNALSWSKRINRVSKKVYIPNGVDLNEFKPFGKKYHTRLKKPIILCVGALTSQKRIDLVIRAVSGLKEASLLVVGAGELKDKLTALGQKLLGDRFEIISKKHSQIPPVYRSADLFTLVSKTSESFGIVFVEALATNLSVVALDDVQRREIIGDAGYYTNPNDILEYRSTLQKALDKNWGRIPRERAEKYSWDKIGEKYEEFFFDLVK